MSAHASPRSDGSDGDEAVLVLEVLGECTAAPLVELNGEAAGGDGVETTGMGVRVVVAGRLTVLGRACREARADVVVVCPTMSKLHCAVVWCQQRSGFFLFDCGSLNGTYASRATRSPADARPLQYEFIGDAGMPAGTRDARSARLEPGSFFKAAACVFYVRDVVVAGEARTMAPGAPLVDARGWRAPCPRMDLQVAAGPDVGVRICVNDLGCVVGRHRLLSTLVIHDAENNLSRAHAQIQYQSELGSFVLVDMSSTGTWVSTNFDPVAAFVGGLWTGTSTYHPSSIEWTRVVPGSPVIVKPGDVIRCGKATVLAVVEPEPSPLAHHGFPLLATRLALDHLGALDAVRGLALSRASLSDSSLCLSYDDALDPLA
ncbi:uncharacterized protein AMSG_06844 [Thecamonas trahens ATCC 50062]|uniref:FHA domain-containing protein n=1 Tax=Thecamonas trahens ATCC 50062 TaxID=461836 RepID=A0A0L0DDY2_THETB|nr:hypothetical protein AMSG_06844 [Thecamonas trahens ATCC 50062]KNC50356.1 hypothetical protein AMSG_06844 [Thecamonas trahens ATCC 50062]|eukprot:XP_013756900.1 hypothetical protein AMSG_06844 [Thecamonas trahens ATCC 50062]